MNRSLIKLIDYSLLPAAILVVGKFFGLFLSIQLFSLEWSIKNIPNTLFSVRPVLFSDDIIVASTYSDIFMFVLIIFGFSAVLIQAVYFHSSHINPQVVAKLANNNLLGLIKSSFDIYHKAAMWGIFMWLADGLIALNVLTSKTEGWVLLFSVFVSIVLSIMLLRDVAQEIALSKKNVVGVGAQ